MGGSTCERHLPASGELALALLPCLQNVSRGSPCIDEWRRKLAAPLVCGTAHASFQARRDLLSEIASAPVPSRRLSFSFWCSCRLACCWHLAHYFVPGAIRRQTANSADFKMQWALPPQSGSLEGALASNCQDITKPGSARQGMAAPCRCRLLSWLRVPPPDRCRAALSLSLCLFFSPSSADNGL